MLQALRRAVFGECPAPVKTELFNRGPGEANLKSATSFFLLKLYFFARLGVSGSRARAELRPSNRERLRRASHPLNYDGHPGSRFACPALRQPARASLLPAQVCSMP